MLTCSQVEIDAPTRIHVSLIGMGDCGPRINGGLGFAISGPTLSVTATVSTNVHVIDQRQVPLSPGEARAIEQLISNTQGAARLDRAPAITITGASRSHNGFGSGTAIRLAALEATFILNGQRPTTRELIAYSHRGGTSGVGIRTYFDGGFTVDVGHKAIGRQRPSRAWRNPALPLDLLRVDMPKWQFGICVPPNIEPLTYEKERAVFENTIPVCKEDVHRALYMAIFGVYAAVAEADELTFASSIEDLQASRWKSAEWHAHGDLLRDVANKLRFAGARGIGLSSMGPALFFLANDFNHDVLPGYLRHSIQMVEPRNLGRRIVVDGVIAA